MKAFRFRLERLLGLAAAERRACAQNLAAEREMLRRWEAEWSAAAAHRSGTEGAWRAEMSSGMPLSGWLDRQSEVELDRRAEARAAQRAAGQRERVAERRDAYLDSRRGERLLESLRSRQMRRWTLEQGRREQRAIDDLAQVAREYRRKGGDATDDQSDSIH